MHTHTIRPALDFMRTKQTAEAAGVSRSGLYARIPERLWPRPVKIGPRAVGWPAGEVAALNAARMAGKTDAEIRALVVKLEGLRASALAE